MTALYLIAAILIAWGIARDVTRRETWMIGFGKVTLRDQPVTFWLTIILRGIIFLAVVAAAWLRNRI